MFQALVLENFKFTLFVLTPIVTASIFWSDAMVEKIVNNRKYISYPPEADKPPMSDTELKAALRDRSKTAGATS